MWEREKEFASERERERGRARELEHCVSLVVLDDPLSHVVKGVCVRVRKRERERDLEIEVVGHLT